MANFLIYSDFFQKHGSEVVITPESKYYFDFLGLKLSTLDSGSIVKYLDYHYKKTDRRKKKEFINGL